MPESSWETFDLSEDINGEEYGDGDSAEFFLPGVPSVGAAAANRLLGRGRRPLPTPTGKGYVPPPPAARAVPATQQQLGVATSRIGEDVKKLTVGMKALEGRLDTYSAQLASFQQKKTGEQAAHLFQYSLTSLAINVPTALYRQDFVQAASQLLPVIQTAVASRGGVAAAFAKTPLSTILWPIVSGVLVWQLRKPEPSVISGGETPTTNLDMTSPKAMIGIETWYTTDDSVPTKKSGTSKQFTAPIAPGTGDNKKGTIIRAKNFNLFGIGSDETRYVVP
jgi:hypothetical protein